VVELQGADVVFYNGLMLEGKMGDVLVRVARQGKPVYAVTEAILEQGDYVMTDEQQLYDPHVWMDVSGWRRAVGVVAGALAEFDSSNAEHYHAKADAYVARLRELDGYVQRVIGSIPENQRVLVTAHDAFNYMGRAYGLEVRGIQGLSTESEAGVQDIEKLVQFLVDRDIPAVFVETSVADKNVRALVEGAKAKGHDVRIGGELFSDAMGPAGTYEGTYIGMIDHNATTIARALGGDAPRRGMQGKLSH
jgi:manganese/zinc/iron transport system substrate-binding protein